MGTFRDLSVKMMVNLGVGYLGFGGDGLGVMFAHVTCTMGCDIIRSYSKGRDTRQLE